MTLEEFLTARRDAGRALLVPYVTGGVAPGWTDVVRAYADAGADAVEIGLPFSDPMLDGVTIQEASDRAIAGGTTVTRILAELAALDVEVPLFAMTYSNLVFQKSAAAFCAALRASGLRGLIVPDSPLEEVGELAGAAAAEGLDLALMAAPSSSPERLREIAARSRGFVYAVTRMGTTGEDGGISAEAARLGRDLTALTDRPVLFGFGVSDPARAAELARHADGVVVASALMRRLLDGAGPRELGEYVASIRRALDRPLDREPDEQYAPLPRHRRRPDRQDPVGPLPRG
ncbi:tryptophan synthase subunit alpha [Herbidospora sp. NEAU-GS84]|uniref:Tryptophan synthase alpha chain n=1 Tax=Herbidospora solisilvae TaxID=2696284 RepID=A0A7C9JPT0_9ACTN|nr:tryptophan synthase subunit alpha [Herbidospora solisilvae]NAS20219.1 tryptophan synthase subunit alpha [Herbidospora solisilvae]